MRIIEIDALPNGAHGNQKGDFAFIPDGWAVIPNKVKIPASFPFVDIVVEDVYGIATVTAMIEREIPAVEEPEPTEAEDTAAMMVDHEYRLTLLELGLFE